MPSYGLAGTIVAVLVIVFIVRALWPASLRGFPFTAPFAAKILGVIA
jgi:hypothetical protein